MFKTVEVSIVSQNRDQNPNWKVSKFTLSRKRKFETTVIILLWFEVNIKISVNIESYWQGYLSQRGWVTISYCFFQLLKRLSKRTSLERRTIANDELHKSKTKSECYHSGLFSRAAELFTGEWLLFPNQKCSCFFNWNQFVFNEISFLFFGTKPHLEKALMSSIRLHF